MQRTHRDLVPTTYVALEGDGGLLGSATLVEHDMSIHQDLHPWLAGVYVKAERRGQGTGSILVRHAVRKAAEMGIKRLYLYTNPAKGFYEKLGWRSIAFDHYEGQAVTIMAIDTVASGWCFSAGACRPSTRHSPLATSHSPLEKEDRGDKHGKR